jgi:hypothetical protein
VGRNKFKSLKKLADGENLQIEKILKKILPNN